MNAALDFLANALQPFMALEFLGGLTLLIASGFASSKRAWPVCMASLCFIAAPMVLFLWFDLRLVAPACGFLTIVGVVMLITLPRSSREEDEAELEAISGAPEQQ